jgi:hypothetical protein
LMMVQGTRVQLQEVWIYRHIKMHHHRNGIEFWHLRSRSKYDHNMWLHILLTNVIINELN